MSIASRLAPARGTASLGAVQLLLLLLAPATPVLPLVPPAAAQDFDRFGEEEMEHYRHFQLDYIGRNPSLADFQRAYNFILPLYLELPQSEAYRICYAQAISGFPATPVNAPLHVRGLEALAGFTADDFAESGHMGILLLNLLERLTEDRALLTETAMAPEVRGAFLQADAVAAAIFSFSLERGVWNKMKPGSTDWTIRPGMPARRAALEALPAEEKAALPDWQAMERTAWFPAALRALEVLKPVLLDSSSYRPAAAAGIYSACPFVAPRGESESSAAGGGGAPRHPAPGRHHAAGAQASAAARRAPAPALTQVCTAC